MLLNYNEMFTKAAIEQYFVKEKESGKWNMIAGLLAVFSGVVLFFIGATSYYYGAALPPVVLGILLFAFGYTHYRRSDARRKRNVYAYDMYPAKLRDEELPRMTLLLKNLKSYRWLFIFLALFGMALFFRFYIVCEGDTCRFSFFRKGMGLTLTIMSTLVLITGYITWKRSDKYVKGLKSFYKMTT